MGLRWVLLLSDRYAELYQLGRGRLLLVQQFEQKPEGIEAFIAWLAQKKIKQPLAILVDLREEAYQIEHIPHVPFYDRKPLLQHKLKRLFKTETYRYAQIQGKTPTIIDNNTGEQRRDDCALFTALNQDQQISPWLQQLLKYKLAISGIYSLPLLANRLFSSNQLNEYSLVLTPSNTLYGDLHLGVRQFFFKRGRLLFSRLLALPNDIVLSRYLAILEEKIEQTRQYLHGVRLLEHQDELRIYILATSEFLEKIRPEILPTGTQAYQYLSLSQLDISQELKSSNVQQFYFRHLMVLYVAKQRVPNHYAGVNEKQYFNDWLWRRSLYAASALCLLFAAGFAANDYYQSFFIGKEIDWITEKTKEQHKRYLAAQSQQKQLLGLSMEVIHIKNTVDSFESLASQFSPMQPYLIWLSQYLNDAPQLYIEEIVWEMRPIQTASKPKTALSDFEKRAAQKRRPEHQAPDILYHANLSFKGYLQPYDGNSTAALRMVNRFVERLRADTKVLTVETKELPLSIDPTQSLDGVVSEKQQQKNKANFHLSILFQAITPPETKS